MLGVVFFSLCLRFPRPSLTDLSISLGSELKSTERTEAREHPLCCISSSPRLFETDSHVSVLEFAKQPRMTLSS